jgi:UDP-N-acetylmuramyl pentapeptide phosphotransferase/UDP-N-acetylglucosamine-1-phosphate transferase
MDHPPPVLLLAALALACGVATFVVIRPLMPVLRRYALARPNARSSHVVPTPQGGGIAVTSTALLAIAATALSWFPPGEERASMIVLIGSAAVLGLLGALDDVRPLPALPRFLVQALAVGATVLMLPAGLRVLPDWLPVGFERLLIVFAGLWFVNLTNFMDGIDWMTVAEAVPVTVALTLLAAIGVLPAAGGVVSAATLGAVLGFAPYNRPVARLFLGDVGSLPLGLLIGYALVRLAGEGHLVAALLLPAYYLLDATITLFRRAARGERVWEAHRSHFYQQATANGLKVMDVARHVFATNIVLALCAGATLVGSDALTIASIIVALATVALLLTGFTRPRPRQA